MAIVKLDELLDGTYFQEMEAKKNPDCKHCHSCEYWKFGIECDCNQYDEWEECYDYD